MGELPLAEATKWTGELLVLPGEGELTETPANAADVMKKNRVVRRNQRLVALCIIFKSAPGDFWDLLTRRGILKAKGGD